MSLKSIRAKVSAKISYPATGDLKTLLDSYINEAANELWVSKDLVGAIKEMLITYEGDAKQITLPYYVLAVRGLRYYNSQYQIPLNDSRPRYGTQGFGVVGLNWREKSKSPLHTQINDESVLRFVLPIVEAVDITIAVIGKTPNSFSAQEQVTIPAGSLEVETVGNYEQVHSITKSSPNLYDIKVYTADATEISVIPNSELSPLYTVIQVLDDQIEGSTPQSSGIECLYKPIFKLLVNDYDEFQANGYDDVIFWKTLEIYHGRSDSAKASERALAAQLKVNQLLDQIAGNSQSGKKLEMDFKPNPLYSLFRPKSWLGTIFRS